jgi:hypothetical protein
MSYSTPKLKAVSMKHSFVLGHVEQEKHQINVHLQKLF